MVVEDAPTALSNAAPKKNGTLTAMALGNFWFPEKQGGLDRVFMELQRHLPSTKITMRGLVLGSERAPVDTEGMVTAFAPTDAPMFKRMRHARRTVQQAILNQPPDITVAHFAPYAFAALNSLRKKPFVVLFHGPWADESGAEGASARKIQVLHAIERRVYRQADRIIVLSAAFRDLLVRGYGVDSDRVRIVPAGVDATQFNTGLTHAQARAALRWPQDRPVVLCVRRLVQRMGLEDLIGAISLAHGYCQIFCC